MSLPDWVLTVIVELEEHEQTHGHPDDGWHCLAGTLEKIPAEMRVYAAAWDRGFKAGQSAHLEGSTCGNAAPVPAGNNVQVSE